MFPHSHAPHAVYTYGMVDGSARRGSLPELKACCWGSVFPLLRFRASDRQNRIQLCKWSLVINDFDRLNYTKYQHILRTHPPLFSSSNSLATMWKAASKTNGNLGQKALKKTAEFGMLLINLLGSSPRRYGVIVEPLFALKNVFPSLSFQKSGLPWLLRF